MNSLHSSLLMQARLLRKAARRTRQRLRFPAAGAQPLPVLFANSFPKSGTHLLTQVLQGFPRFSPFVDSGLPAVTMFTGDTGRLRSTAEILTALRRFQPGDLGYGHLHALPELVEFFCRPGYAQVFILRDPRDVVVSHVNYVTEMEPEHVHHRYYTEQLHTFEERLRTSILGIPQSAAPFPDIRARFEPYLGWLGCQDVLAIQFEEFIENRPAALARVLDFIVRRGFSLTVPREEALTHLSDAINPSRSPTFRSGKIGGWRAAFSEENKTLFKEVSGSLLLDLGYEKSADW